MARGLTESGSSRIGSITLDAKCAGKRSAGKPHAAFEAAGAGDGATDDPTRAQRGKPRTRPREVLRATAPVLDPTRLFARPNYPDVGRDILTLICNGWNRNSYRYA